MSGITQKDKGHRSIDRLSVGNKVIPSDIAFAIAAGGANVSEITISVTDISGNVITGVHNLTVILSDAATGVGLTGTSASGTVQAKSASGTDLAALTAKKALHVQTLADGTYILEITDDAKTTFYVAAVIPSHGLLEVSRILATADYGA